MGIPASLSVQIKTWAKELGFYSTGIVPAAILFEEEPLLSAWNRKGYAGTMTYMQKFGERLERLRTSFPSAKSVIVLTASYYQPEEAHQPTGEPSGRVARYAWGKDYHKALKKKLKLLSKRIREEAGEATLRYFVDTGPILERKLAKHAGLGFIGKNTTLITPAGSYFFLAELVTDLELEYDREEPFDGCGHCTLCIDACPTEAIREPFTVDARRCISYLTIEHRGEIEAELKPKIGEWLFGCDICIDVCPYNSRPLETLWEELKQDGVGASVPLEPILALEDEEAFRNRFGGTPLTRPKREGLMRNAAIVFENLKRKQDGRESQVGKTETSETRR